MWKVNSSKDLITQRCSHHVHDPFTLTLYDPFKFKKIKHLTGSRALFFISSSRDLDSKKQKNEY